MDLPCYVWSVQKNRWFIYLHWIATAKLLTGLIFLLPCLTVFSLPLVLYSFSRARPADPLWLPATTAGRPSPRSPATRNHLIPPPVKRDCIGPKHLCPRAIGPLATADRTAMATKHLRPRSPRSPTTGDLILLRTVERYRGSPKPLHPELKALSRLSSRP
jgi:hypothetical protein